MHARHSRRRPIAAASFAWPRTPLDHAARTQVTMLMLTAEVLTLQGHGDLVIDAVSHAVAISGHRAYAPAQSGTP